MNTLLSIEHCEYIDIYRKVQVGNDQEKAKSERKVGKQAAQGQRSLAGSQLVQSLDKVFFFFFFLNLIKIEDVGVATTLKIDFSNIQGQLTLQSRDESGSNSNSSKM